jgi:glycosyltransferase involved in cell wall biosynthesis
MLSWAESVEVLILCPGGAPNSNIAASCARLGIPFSILDTDTAPFLEDQTEWLLAQWARRPSSVFIANLVLPALYACRWIRKSGGRTIGVIHSNPDHDPFYADVIRHFVGGQPEWCPDSVVAVSEFIAQKVNRQASSTLVVKTISCGTLMPVTLAIPPQTDLRLLYCGRLVQEQKRIRELTAAFLEVTQIPGVTATICGDGEERAWLQNRLTGQDRVRYVGSLPARQMHDSMTQHHVIILLSDYEGLSMSLVEGMACGLVPVCLDEESGAREVIEDGVNGFLVRDRGPNSIQAITKLQDPQVWQRLSQAARKTVEARYSHAVVFGKWAALIRDMASRAQLLPARIPRHISLRTARPDGSFAGYPFCRPTSKEIFGQTIRSSWIGFKLTMRPRSRLREFLRRDAQNQKSIPGIMTPDASPKTTTRNG